MDLAQTRRSPFGPRFQVPPEELLGLTGDQLEEFRLAFQRHRAAVPGDVPREPGVVLGGLLPGQAAREADEDDDAELPHVVGGARPET